MPDLGRRIHTPEIMDDLTQSPEAFRAAYKELATINRRLGGIRAVRRFLPETEGGTLLDVAAGACDVGDRIMLDGTWTVVGLDSNGSGLALAERTAPVVGDAFGLPFADQTFDCVAASLFFHHLSDRECVEVLGEMLRVARRRVIVNDLHRSCVAYWSIVCLANLFSNSAMVRNDGPLSVRRAFRPAELEAIALRAGARGRVYRSFPYRLVLVVDL